MPGSHFAGDASVHLPLIPSGDDAGNLADGQLAAEGEWEGSSFLVCRKLRSKLAFSAVESSEGEHISALDALNGTAVFWCVSTMECAGPDGGLAHQSVCRADRGCYAAKG
jgi:hypothetical protein